MHEHLAGRSQKEGGDSFSFWAVRQSTHDVGVGCKSACRHSGGGMQDLNTVRHVIRVRDEMTAGRSDHRHPPQKLPRRLSRSELIRRIKRTQQTLERRAEQLESTAEELDELAYQLAGYREPEEGPRKRRPRLTAEEKKELKKHVPPVDLTEVVLTAESTAVKLDGSTPIYLSPKEAALLCFIASGEPTGPDRLAGFRTPEETIRAVHLRSRSALTTLVHRLRTRLLKEGYNPFLVETRPGRIRFQTRQIIIKEA